MRGARQVVAAVLAVVLVPLLLGTAEAAGIERVKKAGVLRVGSDITYPPFEFMEAGKPAGFDVEVAQEIAKALGVKLEYVNTAWDGIFAALKAGKFDMLLSGITITEERMKSFDLVFSEPYFESGQGVAVRVGDRRIRRQADLAGKVVGVQINTTGQAAAEKVKGVKEIKKYEQLPEAYLDLKARRLDAVVADYPVIVANAKEDGKFTPVRGLQIGEPERLGIPVRREEADLLAVVNKVVRDLKQSGRYAQMKQKWFGEK
ncbi:MAG: basic amino acid ABC transporter substrate-binding protein [candidate division NC10 bacterium]|nr:basic amino acid ABC transporter substrate-binding protein [candidate division NC10 bacterium]